MLHYCYLYNPPRHRDQSQENQQDPPGTIQVDYLRHQVGPFNVVVTKGVGTDFCFCDNDVTWSTLTSSTDQESVLVRPDGFVSYGPENVKSRMSSLKRSF